MVAREVEDLDAILTMAGFLGEAGYRDLARDGAKQRIAVARRLWREGFNEQLLRMLFAYAEQCGQHPVRLFCYWLDRPSIAVAKANEMRQHSEWARRVLARVEAEGKAVRQEKPAAIHSLTERRNIQ